MTNRLIRRPLERKRRGVTLVELVVSSVSAMTLLAGLTSAIFVASRAVSPSGSAHLIAGASLSLDEIATDMRTLKRVTSRSNRDFAFTVDDRSTDPDSVDESIRYRWSGVAGGSLTRTYNGVSLAVIPNVYTFSFTYLTQTDPTAKRILFLQGNVTGTDATYDNTRVQIMQGLGYTVLRKTTVAATSQSELEIAAACADAIYVSTTVVADDLGVKLKNTALPVILEELEVADSFGLTSSNGATFTDKRIDVIDNSHYFTDGLDLDQLDFWGSNTVMQGIAPNYAAGLRILGQQKSSDRYPCLAVQDAGGTLIDNTTAAGIRMIVPWGGNGTNPSGLNANGLALWQRILDWASRKKYLSAVEVTVQATNSTAPVLYTRSEIVGRPRP